MHRVHEQSIISRNYSTPAGKAQKEEFDLHPTRKAHSASVRMNRYCCTNTHHVFMNIKNILASASYVQFSSHVSFCLYFLTSIYMKA